MNKLRVFKRTEMIVVYIILSVFIFSFILAFIQEVAVRIMLGYWPARWEFKNIDNKELRIYHNGLSGSQCIDEHEYTMTYYYVIPNWLWWLFFTFDGALDKFQKKAIEKKNLRNE